MSLNLRLLNLKIILLQYSILPPVTLDVVVAVVGVVVVVVVVVAASIQTADILDCLANHSRRCCLTLMRMSAGFVGCHCCSVIFCKGFYKQDNYVDEIGPHPGKRAE